MLKANAAIELCFLPTTFALFHSQEDLKEAHMTWECARQCLCKAGSAVSMAGSGSSGSLQKSMQLAVESLRWTYGHFWKFCSQQGMLVWNDGYYNGPIKTTKTVQPSPELTPEEASLQRSLQLKELYESLSTGESSQGSKRVSSSAALLPEDLNELEWFYLLCISFSFPPDVGLPGRTFCSQKPMWVTEANKTDSKHFPRAIIAQSGNIQTILCIPLGDGVFELGTTNEIEEDNELIEQVMVFFMDYLQQNLIHQLKPVLSEHSASNTIISNANRIFYSPPLSMIQAAAVETLSSDKGWGDDVQKDENIDEKDDCCSESEIEPSTKSPVVEEVMQLSTSSHHLTNTTCPINLHSLKHTRVDDPPPWRIQRDDAYYEPWFLQDDTNSSAAQSSESTSSQSSPSQQYAKYAETITCILQQGSPCWAESSSVRYLGSTYSSFSKLKYKEEVQFHKPSSKVTSQRMLKKMLFNVPFFYKTSEIDLPDNKLCKGMPSQDATGLSHVLAERRRREKLNQRFTTLRSMVPFVTKMDKASILEDTIEYVKQLRARIRELESRDKMTGTEERKRSMANVTKGKVSAVRTSCVSFQEMRDNEDQSPEVPNKTKNTMLLGRGSPYSEARRFNVQTIVEVSIIEEDALLEIQCSFSESLLLAVMKALQLLQLRITSVQSSSTNGVLNAKLRAKVQENGNGRKPTIAEVKEVITQILLNSK